MLDGEQISPEREKLLRTIREFGNYIADNQAYILDYGDRHRNGKRINAAFAESAVNQLVRRRMVKRQFDQARLSLTVARPRTSDEWRSARYFQSLVSRKRHCEASRETAGAIRSC